MRASGSIYRKKKKKSFYIKMTTFNIKNLPHKSAFCQSLHTISMMTLEISMVLTFIFVTFFKNVDVKQSDILFYVSYIPVQ